MVNTIATLLSFLISLILPQAPPQSAATRAHTGMLFQTSDQCLACHNNIVTSSAEDVSIGADWQSSMMAHSSRDPYWQAGVRREIMDHSSAKEKIEDECSICHMPMARTQAVAEGRAGSVFAHLPAGRGKRPQDQLAADGVSCTMCHQITSEKFGTPESFTGGFVVDTRKPAEEREIFGRFEIDNGRTMIMRSATGFKPSQGKHVEQSELCATCHTLITEALGPGGEVVGRLPEQVMYLEWRHSDYRETQSCQACHMPVVREETPISSVLGELRQGFARHTFQGGNFFMLRMLSRYRTDPGVVASARELDTSANRTVRFLQSETAAISIDDPAMLGGRFEFNIDVRNLSGHKLPTAYPSRRVWLHVTVRDQSNRVVFESGGLAPTGLIEGNDNDADPARYESHYREIRQSDQVQIYESIMADTNGAVTTGLLTGAKYVKDNRLIPRGFDKSTAEPDIAVVGDAAGDGDFVGGADRIRYSIDIAGAMGPLQIAVELRFQPIGFRWAENLRRYESPETRRFLSYYDSMSAASSEVLGHASRTVR